VDRDRYKSDGRYKSCTVDGDLGHYSMGPKAISGTALDPNDIKIGAGARDERDGYADAR
jgi:hypothetical protein